jgi:hypothetical protein
MQIARASAEWRVGELVGVSDAARILGGYRNDIYRAMERGDLPYAKIGGARVMPISEVRAYRERRRRRS